MLNFVKNLMVSTTKTTSFAGVTVCLEGYNKACFHVITTNKGGTSPTLDIKVQGSVDGTNWADMDYLGGTTGVEMPQITGNTNQVLCVKDFPRFVRLYYTIGGTSPTFDIETWVFAKG